MSLNAMKLIVVTMLLAFSAGATAVAIFSGFAGAQFRPKTDMEISVSPRPVTPVEPLQRQEQIDTATIGVSSFSGSKPDVQAELTGWNDHWLINYFDESASGEGVASRRVPSPTEGLNLPVNSNVRLTLTSRDFVYMLSLPQISKTQIAVPGQSFALEFRTLTTGSFLLRGDHLCGPPRPTLSITANVGSTADLRN